MLCSKSRRVLGSDVVRETATSGRSKDLAEASVAAGRARSN